MFVSRDPFAREELHKEPVEGECAFCGSSNRYGKVWKFRVEYDGGRKSEIKGKFCSKACLSVYHE
jgi:hypothetical protein